MAESESQKYKPKFIRSQSLVKKGSSVLTTVPLEYFKKYNLKTGKNQVMVFEYGKALLIVPVSLEGLIERVLREYLPATS